MGIAFSASADWFISRTDQRRVAFFFKKTGVSRIHMALLDGPPSNSAEVQNERLTENHHEGPSAGPARQEIRVIRGRLMAG